MNQKSYVLTAFIPFLLLLGACGGKKPQKVTPRNKSGQVAMPVPGDDQNIQLSFFDEEVGAFDDVESFVLDNDANQNDSLVLASNNDGQEFNLQEIPETDQDAQVVFFNYDSYKIREDQKPAVAELTNQIKEWVNEGKTVVFKGHSCKWHGTRAYNLALSGQRAQWIADYCKVPKDNVKVFGVGNEEPLVFDSTKDGQGPNRRVEVYAIAA